MIYLEKQDLKIGDFTQLFFTSFNAGPNSWIHSRVVLWLYDTNVALIIIALVKLKYCIAIYVISKDI